MILMRDTLLLCSILTLISIVLSIRWRALRFIDVSLFGYVSFVPYLLNSLIGTGASPIYYLAGIVITILIISLLAFVTTQFLYRPMGHMPSRFLTLVSLCLFLMLYYIPQLIWRKYPISVDSFNGMLSNSGVNNLQWVHIFGIICLVVIVVVSTLLSRTVRGIAFRAHMGNRSVAQMCGVSDLYALISLSLITGILVTFFSVILGSGVYDDSISGLSLSVVSLAIVFLIRRRPVSYVFFASLIISLLIQIVAHNIDKVSYLYQRIASIFIGNNSITFSSDFAYVLVPIFIVICGTFILRKKEGINA